MRALTKYSTKIHNKQDCSIYNSIDIPVCWYQSVYLWVDTVLVYVIYFLKNVGQRLVQYVLGSEKKIYEEFNE